MSPEDRRRAPREPLTLKVEYNDADEMVADFTDNISTGGTFVLTSRLLPEGTAVRLVLSFPGLIKPLPLTGIVKWSREDPPEERGLGVAFDGASQDAMERLGEMVERIASGDPELVAKILRVLVVEDNPHVASLIREGLQGGGKREMGVSFHCTTVSNGREALTTVRSQSFDVLIVDVYLPVMDGPQLIAQVRADEALRGIPIVAVSGGGHPARTAAMAAGADFFLDKPMRLADIVATMRRLTGIV